MRLNINWYLGLVLSETRRSKCIMCFNTILVRSVQHTVRKIVGYQTLLNFNWSILDEKPSARLVLRCDAHFHPVCMRRNDISSQAAC